MNLYLIGHDYRYAAEQMLLTLFPDERPEYPDAPPLFGEDALLLRLSVGPRQVTAHAVLTYGGAVAQPHASEGAGGDAAVKLNCSGAGDDPLVFHPVGGVVVGSHAVDQGGFVFYLAGGNAEKLGGSRGHCGAARGA